MLLTRKMFIFCTLPPPPQVSFRDTEQSYNFKLGYSSIYVYVCSPWISYSSRFESGSYILNSVLKKIFIKKIILENTLWICVLHSYIPSHRKSIPPVFLLVWNRILFLQLSIRWYVWLVFKGHFGYIMNLKHKNCT